LKKATFIVIVILFLVLLMDQSLKIWVKTNMEYGEEILLGGLSWAKLHFVENNGMAFGLSLGENYGKLLLSVFRIIAVVILVFYIRQLIKSKASIGLLASFTLILAGAIGNIIDSAFYGLIFSESFHGDGLAVMFPPEGGYASFLYGRVVDMLYFPMVNTTWPSWIPYLGDQPLQFFRPVFNIADMSITTGVLAILFFHRSFFQSLETPPAEETMIDVDTNKPTEITEPEAFSSNPSEIHTTKLDNTDDVNQIL